MLARTTMSKQCDCGLYKNPSGGYSRYWPSDCHVEGGHYSTEYDEEGRFLYTNAPWQVDPDKSDLTLQERSQAA
jgi:hypothetical protein